MRRLNLPLWLGVVVMFAGAFGYVYLFSRWPVTRDYPWTAMLLFAVALVLFVLGFRRAQRKVVPSIVIAISLGLMALFCFEVFVGTKWIPASKASPAPGQKAPDFTLADASHRNVALSQLLATPGTNGVLLIFYRGYW